MAELDNPLLTQGWVPATCTLTAFQAMLLLPSCIRGEDPCEGCNHDRAKCQGRPKKAGGSDAPADQ